MTERSGGRLALLAPGLVAALAIVFTVRPLDDFDTWYHLAAGRLMWTTWVWPSVNTFSFTAPDYPWIDLHWMFQLLLYGAWAVGGPNGCIVLATILMLATVGILYANGRRFAPPMLVALLLAIALTVASPRFVPRPELLSFVLFAAYLWLLDGFPRCGRAIYLLVPLQVLWTNAQGIFGIGLALIGFYWIGATLAFLPLPRSWRETNGCTPAEWRRLTITLVLAAAACFLNPYGIEGVRFPFQLLDRVTGSSIFSTRIGEFRGPFRAGYAPALAYTWVALLAVTGLSFLVNLRRLHIGRLLAAAAFGYLSSQALRNMALFAWIAVPVIAANIGPILPTARPVRTAQRAERRRSDAAAARGAVEASAAGGATFSRAALAYRLGDALVVGAILVLIALAGTNQLSRMLGTERELGFGISRVRFPIEALDFARQVGIGGRPFNCLATGGYLAWARFPEERVFVDGRLEAYPEPFFRSYFRALDDPTAWPETAAQYQLDYALLYHVWSNRFPLARYLAGGHGWTLVYYDEIASLFLPVSAANAEVRERAVGEFAAIKARRLREPAPAPPSSFERAIRVPVEETYRQVGYGDFLRAIGQNAEAVEAYKRALALDPDGSEARLSLAMAHWYSGNRNQALLELRDLVRREPTNERAARTLEEAQAAMGRQGAPR